MPPPLKMLHMPDEFNSKDLLSLPPGQGRVYHLGGMTAIFKADGEETRGQYSVSEWWLEPGTEGPAPHHHDDKEHVFFILEGRMDVFVDGKWSEAVKGSFLRIPRHATHTFANRTQEKTAFLNIDIPGGFESSLPAMEAWFRDEK